MKCHCISFGNSFTKEMIFEYLTSYKNGNINDLKYAQKLIDVFATKVVVFPEGTRSDDGGLKPLRSGVAFLALQSRCPIIPCYVGGSYEAWPRSRKWPRLRGVRTYCRFGRPISPLDANGNPVAKETLNELLYEAIARLAAP